MKGQISIEMIIILAVLLTLVLVVATKLQQSGASGREAIAAEESKIMGIINETSKMACGNFTTGEPCVLNSECASCKCTLNSCE